MVASVGRILTPARMPVNSPTTAAWSSPVFLQHNHAAVTLGQWADCTIQSRPSPWRSTTRDGWPRLSGNRWRVPISRTYYTVRTPTALLEVYRDDLADDWYLQRVIN